MLELFGHPFSSYTQKVLIALWANETPFEYRLLEQDHPENFEELKRYSPFGLFPLLVDDGKPVLETSIIIEHLQLHHPGPTTWIPDGDQGLRARFLDRFFDLYIMNTMQVGVANALRPEGTRLHIAYDWLEKNIGEPWAIGDRFTMADCAAAPSLFYADWVEEMGDTRPRLKAYRQRLLAHPIVARAVDEGRPYRHYFPLGAPDRD
jgi:glutathione S-transferase